MYHSLVKWLQLSAEVSLRPWTGRTAEHNVKFACGTESPETFGILVPSSADVAVKVSR